MFQCFYLRVPQIRPVLCQRTKAPVLLYYYDNGEKICRMFFIRRLPRKRQPFGFSRALSDICPRSVNLVLPFLNSIMLIT